jgi:hypothetical protein
MCPSHKPTAWMALLSAVGHKMRVLYNGNTSAFQADAVGSIPSTRSGAVAQLGERHTCTVDVAGSIPVSSTKRVVSQLGDFTSALGKLVRVLYSPYKLS